MTRFSIFVAQLSALGFATLYCSCLAGPPRTSHQCLTAERCQGKRITAYSVFQNKTYCCFSGYAIFISNRGENFRFSSSYFSNYFGEMENDTDFENDSLGQKSEIESDSVKVENQGQISDEHENQNNFTCSCRKMYSEEIFQRYQGIIDNTRRIFMNILRDAMEYIGGWV